MNSIGATSSGPVTDVKRLLSLNAGQWPRCTNSHRCVVLLYLEGVDNLISVYLHNDDEGSDVACFTQGRDSKLFLLVTTTRKRALCQISQVNWYAHACQDGH